MAALQFLLDNSRPIEEGERIGGTWVATEPGGDLRALELKGTDERHWFPKFTELQIQDVRDGITDQRFFEVLPPAAHTKLSVIIPEKNSHCVRLALIHAVSTLLLDDSGNDKAELSFWYELDNQVYGVWPCIALNHSARVAAVKTLEEGWKGLPGADDPRNELVPKREYFAHYNAQIRFPLPGAGTKILGAFGRDGNSLKYNSDKHSGLYKHLATEGAFFGSPSNPELATRQVLTVFSALRIGNLERCTALGGRLKDPGFTPTFRVNTTQQALLAKNKHAPIAEVLGEEETPEPQDPLPRLDWSEEHIFNHRTCVSILKRLIATKPEHNYRAAFAQLNLWFLKEGYGANAPLYYKGYDSKKLLSDPSNSCRFVTLNKASKSDIASRLSDCKIKVSNPDTGKAHSEEIFRVWLSHADLNVVSEVVVHPRASLLPLEPYPKPGNLFNSWRHWDFFRHGHYERLKALHANKSLEQLFALPGVRDITALVYGILCNREIDTFRVITLILANILMYPDDPCRKAVAFLGPEGAGKSILSDALIERVLGFTHSIVFSDPEFIVGRFTNMLSGKAFCAVEEAFFGGDKVGCGKLKQKITSAWQMLNEKFGDIRVETNMATYWMNTNNEFLSSIGENGRRFVVADVSELVTYLSDETKVGFFKDLVGHLQTGDGVFEYAYFLSRLNLDVWMRDRKGYIHINHALAMQKVQTMVTQKPVHTWLSDCIINRSLGTTEETEPVTNPDGTKTLKRKVTHYLWDSTYSLPQLYSLFKKASSRATFVTLDTFIVGLVTALRDCEDFDADAPQFKVRLQESDPLQIDKEAVRHIKMPTADSAKKSLEGRVQGIEQASGADWAKGYKAEAKRNRTLASSGEVTPAALLPKDAFKELFVNNCKWEMAKK